MGEDRIAHEIAKQPCSQPEAQATLFAEEAGASSRPAQVSGLRGWVGAVAAGLACAPRLTDPVGASAWLTAIYLSAAMSGMYPDDGKACRGQRVLATAESDPRTRAAPD